MISEKDNELGVIERKEYDRLKRRAIRFEANNLKYILVLPCDGKDGWCEMGERSALIYKYEVCMKIGAPVSLKDDADSFFIQYKYGRIRTRGFDTVRRRLEKVGLYKREVKRDRCILFELKKEFTKEEIKKLEEDEKSRQLKANMIIKVHGIEPVLYQKMILTGTRLHQICFRRLDKLSSRTNGERIVGLMDDIIREYFVLATSRMGAEERIATWRRMYNNTQLLMIELQIVAGLKLWSRDVCVSVGEEVLEIREIIEGIMKNATSKSCNNDRKN